MIRKILDLSEVWALLIPLFFLLRYKIKPPYLKPIRLFIWIALLLNIFIILIQEYKARWWHLTADDFLWNNNFLYNIESVIRLLLFAWFFILLNQRFMHRLKAVIPFAFILFVLVNFIFFEKFFPRGDYEAFSSRLLATESALLLFYCLQYFIYLIIEEKTTNIRFQPGFWVVTGLTVYVAASFFIYLFYDYLTDSKRNFAIDIWDVHNVVFIILNLFIAIQFYQENKTSRR